MRYLHTMLRVRNLDAALDFYVNKLGLKETRRRVDKKNKLYVGVPGRAGDHELVEAARRRAASDRSGTHI